MRVCSYDPRYLTYAPFPLIGLSYGTDDQSLKEAFSTYGDIEFGTLNRIAIISILCTFRSHGRKILTASLIVNRVLLFNPINLVFVLFNI